MVICKNIQITHNNYLVTLIFQSLTLTSDSKIRHILRFPIIAPSNKALKHRRQWKLGLKPTLR